MLPNFNSYTISLTPGQNLGVEALDFIQGERAHAEDVDNIHDVHAGDNIHNHAGLNGVDSAIPQIV